MMDPALFFSGEGLLRSPLQQQQQHMLLPAALQAFCPWKASPPAAAAAAASQDLNRQGKNSSTARCSHAAQALDTAICGLDAGDVCRPLSGRVTAAYGMLKQQQQQQRHGGGVDCRPIRRTSRQRKQDEVQQLKEEVRSSTAVAAAVACRGKLLGLAHGQWPELGPFGAVQLPDQYY
jgi:hypothetical protein